MKEINLRDFYCWHHEEDRIAVSEEVLEALLADRRYQNSSRRRIYRNKAYYSLDAGDGIEYSACVFQLSPLELVIRRERAACLYEALKKLPTVQRRRIASYYLWGTTVKELAGQDGVTENAVTASMRRGLKNLKEVLEPMV